MRDLIDLVENAERMPSGFKPVQNPSKAAFNAALSRAKVPSEGLRGLVDDAGNLYVWDAYYANHDEAEDALGLSNTLSIHLYHSHPELDADMVDEDDLPAVCARILACRTLQRLYGQSFDFQIEQGYDVKWASEIAGDA